MIIINWNCNHRWLHCNCFHYLSLIEVHYCRSFTHTTITHLWRQKMYCVVRFDQWAIWTLSVGFSILYPSSNFKWNPFLRPGMLFCPHSLVFFVTSRQILRCYLKSQRLISFILMAPNFSSESMFSHRI